MTKDIAIADEVPFLGADWFDPLEAASASTSGALLRTCWKKNLPRLCGAAGMTAALRRLGIATATGTANCSAHSDR